MKATKLNATTHDEAVKALPAHFKPGLFVLQIAHDDGCPAIASKRDTDCKPPCKPDFYLIEPFAATEAA